MKNKRILVAEKTAPIPGVGMSCSSNNCPFVSCFCFPNSSKFLKTRYISLELTAQLHRRRSRADLAFGFREEVWTGYTMALVGPWARGYLPCHTALLLLKFAKFTGRLLLPMLVLTFLNPIGATNSDFVAPGSGIWSFVWRFAPEAPSGGCIGPFFGQAFSQIHAVLRMTLGVALALFGIQLCYKAVKDHSKYGRVLGSDFLSSDATAANAGQFSIRTLHSSLYRISIAFGREEKTLSNIHYFSSDAASAFFSRIGCWRRFSLVPIFAMAYRIPLYVMVAATIPYTIVLSGTGIFSFVVILPLLGIPAIRPKSLGVFLLRQEEYSGPRGIESSAGARTFTQSDAWRRDRPGWSTLCD